MASCKTPFSGYIIMLGDSTMAYPLKIKEKAIKLRKKGYSLKEISEKLKIAKGTASIWLNDVKLSQKAQERLQKREILGQYKSHLIRRKKRRKLFETYLK
ncbi:MAG: hypothetical protein HQ536_03210, partial [Parcubacteria group bacterium]|nr:hypothetical protein [Parcubacteria group bacterium]